MRPRVRLSLASCAFVFIMTYVALHNQQPGRRASAPPPDTAPVAAVAPVSDPQPEAGAAGQPGAAGIPRAVLDPQPSWGAAPVPVLQPSLAATEATAADAMRPQPGSQEGAGTEADVSPVSAALPPAASTPEAVAMPLPRPRPRKRGVTASSKRPAVGAPLRLN